MNELNNSKRTDDTNGLLIRPTSYKDWRFTVQCILSDSAHTSVLLWSSLCVVHSTRIFDSRCQRKVINFSPCHTQTWSTLSRALLLLLSLITTPCYSPSRSSHSVNRCVKRIAYDVDSIWVSEQMATSLLIRNGKPSPRPRRTASVTCDQTGDAYGNGPSERNPVRTKAHFILLGNGISFW